MAKQVKTPRPSPGPARTAVAVLITPNLKKRKVPKADGRYLIYYEKP